MEPNPEKILERAKELLYHAYLYTLPQFRDPVKERHCRRAASKLEAKAARQAAKLKGGR